MHPSIHLSIFLPICIYPCRYSPFFHIPANKKPAFIVGLDKLCFFFYLKICHEFHSISIHFNSTELNYFNGILFNSEWFTISDLHTALMIMIKSHKCGTCASKSD